MVSSLLGFLAPNKIFIVVIGVLLTSTATAGYLLKNSYETVGKQKIVIEQSILTAAIYEQAYNELDEKLLVREKERNRAWAELGVLKEELGRVIDETNCIDSLTPASLRLLFENKTPS